MMRIGMGAVRRGVAGKRAAGSRIGWTATLAQQATQRDDANLARLISAGERDGQLVVEWDDGEQHGFHICWLRDNCDCPRCKTESGQKLHRDILPGHASLAVLSAEVANDGEHLEIRWKDHDSSDPVARFDSGWLRKFGYSSRTIVDESRARSAPHAVDAMPQVSFEEIMSGDAGVWAWMTRMDDAGYCLVRDCPVEEGTVKRVANLVGPTSHRIYGETFDVKATPNPINIAYTDSALEPHMDLAYYESPPGVQMLHCVKFDEGVVGGNSTLIDGHAVATEFKSRHPEHFKVLTSIPATFQKDHVERENPLKMFYQRPHLNVNYLGDVTAVFWSPPFEGPLRVAHEFVEPYYAAYHAFRSLLADDEMWDKYGCEFRMRPGDLLVFNNRRMLHGRTAFKAANGSRHLQGCYLDVDTYLNKYRVFAADFDPAQADACLGAPRESRFGISSHR